MLTVAANTDLGEKLREIRNKTRLSMTAFADAIGVPRSTYKNWEYGIVSNIDPAVLKRAEALINSEVSAPLIPGAQLLVPIPYIGGISASSKVDWTDPYASETFIEVPPEMAGSGRFAALILSDSMYDLLMPGDTVVFQAHNVPTIGRVIMFRSPDDLVTVKTLKHNGKGFILVPENSAYETCDADGTVVGYLVGIVRTQGSRKVTVYDSTGIRP